MFNVANRFEIVLNLYMKRLLSENLFEKYKVDDFESFLKRENESMKVSQLSNAQSHIVYMLFDNKLKDLLTSFITSRKSNLKQSNNIIDESIIDKKIVIDEDIIDENIIDKNVVIDEDIINENIIDKDVVIDEDIINENIIDKDVVIDEDIINEDITDKDAATNKDVIDEDIATNKNIIDKNIVTNKNIIDKNIITNKNVIEKVITKKIDTKRSKRDQINDCNCREFDEF
jgi:hypothetical protein